MTEEEAKLLTPAEAAARLRVSPITLRSWAEKGLITAQVTAGGHRRYQASQIEKMLGRTVATGDEPLRLMIVDDDPFMLALLREMLRDQILEIEVARDGFEAGLKLGPFRPDVILLDLMMPKIDGFSVCEQIKRDPATSHIRVIAMTGEASLVNASRILSVGAEACLSKPLNKLELFRVLKLHPDPTHAA